MHQTIMLQYSLLDGQQELHPAIAHPGERDTQQLDKRLLRHRSSRMLPEILLRRFRNLVVHHRV
jgi:hypothetical protein